MYKANVKRSLRGADAAQERDHVGFVKVDGELEGSAAVTAAQRVDDDSNASSRAGKNYRTCSWQLHQPSLLPTNCKFPSILSMQQNAAQSIDCTRREGGGNIWNFETRVEVQAEQKAHKNEINHRISARKSKQKCAQNKRCRGKGGGALLFVLCIYRGGFVFNQNFAGLKVPVSNRGVEGNLLVAAKNQ